MKSVLVVDDEQAFAYALELALSGQFRVLKAWTGEEALLSIRDYKPDLVLMDIMMPGLGGLETLKLLRTHPEYKKLPVIIMSGARPLARQTDYEWSDFIEKPFSKDELIERIGRFI